MEKLRTFIAIDLDEEVRRRIDEVQRLLKKTRAEVRWVDPAKVHLTLKFLGDTLPGQVEAINAVLASIASERDDFEITFGGLGVFGGERNPRVIWIGVQQGFDHLRGLQPQIDRGLKTRGFKPENRKYSPHLTLARFKSRSNVDQLLEVLEKHRQDNCGTLRAGAVHLVKSTLTPSGPLYEKLFSAPLRCRQSTGGIINE